MLTKPDQEREKWTDLSWYHYVYYASAIALSVWGIAVGMYIIFSDTISRDAQWWGLAMALTTIGLIYGLWWERRRTFPAVLIVLAATVFIGISTLQAVFPLVLLALILVCRFWIGRHKVLERQGKPHSNEPNAPKSPDSENDSTNRDKDLT